MERKREHGDIADTDTYAGAGAGAGADQMACAHTSAREDTNGMNKRLHLDHDETEDPEPADPNYRLLERYRKDAMYRRMREAKRDAARAREQEASLHEALARTRHSVLLVNQFWDALDALIHPMQRAQLSDGKDLAPISLTHTTEEQAAALAERRSMLEALLSQTTAAALAAAPSLGSSSANVYDDKQQCITLTAELSAVRQAFETTRLRLVESQEHTEHVTELLRHAEKRLDRLMCESVRAVEDPQGYERMRVQNASQSASATNDDASATFSSKTDGSSSATRDAPASEALTAEKTAHVAVGRAGTSDLVRGPAFSSPAHAMQEELDKVRDLAHARQQALDAVRSELLEAQQACASCQLQLQHVPDDRVRAHPIYQALHADVAYMQQELDHVRDALASSESENASLREFRADFVHQTTTQAKTHNDELQKQLNARDADMARLRTQRDELNAELLERRSRESVRFAQIDEAKAFLASKEERMAALHAQVARLQAELEALRADAAGSHGQDDGHEHGQASDSAQATASGHSQAPAQLQRQLQAAHTSSAMLSDEVDRLSAAYDELVKQADARVSNAARMEDKILRLTTEKAKADNKYFAAMRARDALDAEKRALTRSAERQAKVIERYTETERAMQAQIQLAEKEVSALRKSVQMQASRLNETERDASTLRRRLAEAERARHAAETSVAQHLERATREATGRQEAMERASLLDREAGRLRRRVTESTAARRHGNDQDTNLEYLNSLLRCSACKERYRDRIILRCMHTFCEACVNARIQTRQRKCPHCGLAFATSDVQVLYCTYDVRLTWKCNELVHLMDFCVCDVCNSASVSDTHPYWPSQQMEQILQQI